MTDPASSDPSSEAAPIALADAAESLGVHYMTAYRYIRTGKLHAVKRGGQWWVAPEDLQAFSDGSPVEGAKARPRDQLVEPLTNRLLAGDNPGSWNVVDEALRGGATPAEVHTSLIAPAMESIGAMWAADEISIAAEHRATASAHRLLGQMGPLFRHRGRRRGVVVIGCVAGDPHALPSAMLSDLLTDRRLEVVDLGANTPPESFIDAASEVDGLVGVGLCVVLNELLDTAVEAATAVRAGLPETMLIVGGPVIAANASRFQGIADRVTSTAVEACDAFDEAAESDSGRHTADVESAQRASG